MAEMTKILFVDDEPRILEGLRRKLHYKSNVWKTEYANSGIQALEMLEKEEFNVIISDMRMPNMDGATLLQKVQELYPKTIRIVLSGQTELEMVMRTALVAHQFLTKPCDPANLEEIVARSCNLQNLINCDHIKKVVCKIDRLLPLPKTYQDLVSALSDPNISIEKISSIIEKDIAISAKILQLANSSFFGHPCKTTSILQAINYVGMESLKYLTLTMGVFNSFKDKNNASIPLIEKLQNHSLACAHLAKGFFEDKQKSNDAFLAGMLHEIGRLLLISHFSSKYEEIQEIAATTKQELFLIEKEVLGATHGEIGGYLLGIWGLPYPVVEAVTYHHDPSKVNHKEFDVLSAVYVANRLVNDTPEESSTIDMKYLEMLGVEELLPKWKEIAHAQSNKPL